MDQLLLQRPARAVFTGFSAIVSNAVGAQELFQACLENRTGIRPMVRRLEPGLLPCTLAAELPDEDYEDTYLTRKEKRWYSSLNARAALAAFRMASEDAGLDYFDPFRSCVYLAAAGEGYGVIEETLRRHPAILNGFERIHPMGFTNAGYPTPGAAVCKASGIRHLDTTSLSCASALIAAGRAMRDIQTGRYDVAVIVAVDFPLASYVLTSFCTAGAYSVETSPYECVRPFGDDSARRPVPGEGVIVMVLESEEFACTRGARIYSELLDEYHNMENHHELFLIDPTGKPWAEVVERVAAGRRIAHINAHGCGDPTIDKAEARAYNMVFGNQQPLTSSVKGLLGSSWAVGGASQLLIESFSISSGHVPGTHYCPRPDPALVDLGLNLARKASKVPALTQGDVGLVVSHGFTGVNAAVALKRYIA